MKEFGEKLRELLMVSGEKPKGFSRYFNISFQSVSKGDLGFICPWE